MIYNFDEIIDRSHTNSFNAEGFRGILQLAPGEEIPPREDGYIRMWVADMDFAVAPEILDEIPPLSLIREFVGGCTLEKE